MNDQCNWIIVKIKKCLALSKSSNEHEAAAALRIAQELMEKYDVSENQILASEVSEQRVKSGARRRPVNWEAILTDNICRAFGCEKLYSPAVFKGRHGEWVFIGCGPAPEIAKYATTVLLRQAREARRTYIKKHLKRCKPVQKTRRADLYCDGWVRTASDKLHNLIVPKDHYLAIEAYCSHFIISEMTTIMRVPHGKLGNKGISDYASGYLAGRDADLNNGVDGYYGLTPGLIAAG